MPAVRLTTYECDRNLLPRVCARCGVPTEGDLPFIKMTPVTNVALGVLLVTCPPAYLALVHVLLSRRAFRLPLCDRDRDDWAWRDRLTTGTYTVTVVSAYCAGVALIIFFLPPWGWPELIVGCYLAVFYLWMIPALLLWTRTVRISKVMKRGIRLSGVHAEFVAALMTDRIRARDLDPARVAWYGDARDDFEENWSEFGAFRPDAAEVRDGAA